MRIDLMKLTQIAFVAVLSTAFVGPAFAAMSQAEMDAMKSEMTSAGKTDQERVAFWKTMKPERQAAWKAQCNSGELSSLSQSEIENRGDIPSFCKSINGGM